MKELEKAFQGLADSLPKNPLDSIGIRVNVTGRPEWIKAKRHRDAIEKLAYPTNPLRRLVLTLRPKHKRELRQIHFTLTIVLQTEVIMAVMECAN